MSVFRKTKKRFLPVFLVVCLALALIPTCFHAAAERPEYLTTRAELVKALADGREVIHVGDIAFDDGDVRIPLSRSVTLIGRTEGSLFSRARFELAGPEVESERISVTFQDITFDGCYVQPAGDPGNAASFDAFHGDRTGMGCITAKGFIRLSMENCVIRRYCCKYGAAMYLAYTDGNKDIGTRISLLLKNCLFAENTSERGVVWCNGKHTAFEMDGCTVSDNNAYGGVVVLGSVCGTVERLTVRNNRRVVFREKNTFTASGGGLAVVDSDLIIRDSLIEGNAGRSGGGMMAIGSRLTLDSCVIRGNKAEESGGGLMLHSAEDAPVYVTNCLISGNSAEREGAVWVWPADQIGIGLPNGIVEFSFCTFEDNRSSDPEHLVFHPVISENAETAQGRDGTVDLIACRISDPAVSPSVKGKEAYNVINADEKGQQVPEDVVLSVANGYYKDRSFAFPAFAGVQGKTEHPSGALPYVLAAGGGILMAILISVLIRVCIRRRRKKASGVPEPETPEETPPCPPESGETDARVRILTEKGLLSERETEVLKEYLLGKKRGEIASDLFISESTVKNHISNIFSKLNVSSRQELIDKSKPE